MCDQIQQIYKKPPGEEKSPEKKETAAADESISENMKHIYLLSMIKEQQQKLLVQSALEHLNYPVVLKLRPRTKTARDSLQQKGLNPYIIINTKLIKRVQEIYQQLSTRLFGRLNRSLVLHVDEWPAPITYQMVFNSTCEGSPAEKQIN